MHDELVSAIRESPAVFLHQGHERETKQLLLSFLLRYGEEKKKKEREKGITHLSARLRSSGGKHNVETREDQEMKPALPAPFTQQRPALKLALSPAAPSSPMFPPPNLRVTCLG